MKYRDEDGDFQELYFKASDTLPVGTEVDYDGETAPAGWEEIDEPKDTYSTDEVKTNKVWIDGKPIYRKVISTNLPSGTGWNLTFAPISNVDEIVNLYGIEEKSRFIPYIESGYEVFIDYNNGYIRVYQASTAFNNKLINIIVEYTKTTDQGGI